jgi:membrane-associated two-gene conflict system component 1 (EACC1)
MPVLPPDDTSVDRPRLESLSASWEGPEIGIPPGLTKEPVTVRISVTGAAQADLTRDLTSWLADECELRGRIHTLEQEPPAYALGTGSAVLEVMLGPGGAAMALASVAITWLRCRTGKVTITFSLGNGRMATIGHGRVKNLDAKGIQDLTTQILNVISDSPSPSDTAEDSSDEHAAA